MCGGRGGMYGVGYREGVGVGYMGRDRDGVYRER